MTKRKRKRKRKIRGRTTQKRREALYAYLLQKTISFIQYKELARLKWELSSVDEILQSARSATHNVNAWVKCCNLVLHWNATYNQQVTHHWIVQMFAEHFELRECLLSQFPRRLSGGEGGKKASEDMTYSAVCLNIHRYNEYQLASSSNENHHKLIWHPQRTPYLNNNGLRSIIFHLLRPISAPYTRGHCAVLGSLANGHKATLWRVLEFGCSKVEGHLSILPNNIKVTSIFTCNLHNHF